MRLPGVLALVLLAACDGAREGWEAPRARGFWMGGPRPALPAEVRPTEVAHTLAEEKAGSRARKAWNASRHRTPPGVDWKAIELANGRAQLRKRQALAAAPGGAPPPTAAGGAPGDGDAWTERGSQNQAGRMYVAATSGGALYAGSALGGLWQQLGDTWTPLSDDVYGGVHQLVVVEGSPPTLLIGSQSGVLARSTDLGATWTEPSGLDLATSQRRLFRLADGSGALFAVRGDGRDYALWRSTDDGASWGRVFGPVAHALDAWAPRTGAPGLYLAETGTLSVSTDLGDTWTSLGDYAGTSARTELAGSEAWIDENGHPRLYVVDDQKDLRRSDDGGYTWADVATPTDYWGVLAASVVNADLVAYGGVEVYASRDGGSTATKVNAWSDYYDDPENRLHADLMGLVVEPGDDGGETWYLGTDGGLYASTDGLATVRNLSMSGLRVSQYYSTLTSSADAEHVAAGAQDQGYQLTQGQEPSDHLLNFEQVISGDYAQLTSTGRTHDLVYSVYPGFLLVQVGERRPQLTYANFPADAQSYAWLPVLMADPDDPERCYFGGDRLWVYERTDYWVWTPTLASDQDFADARSEFVAGLAFAPSDHDRFYAVTSEGRFFASADHGLTWTASDAEVPFGNWYSGTAVAVDPLDPDRVYVGGSGYGGAPVFLSTDGGASFEAWSDGLPSTLVYALATDPATGVVYAATETAAYRRDPHGDWVDITGSSAPVTIYWSVEVVPELGTVRFGTYGRGAWDYDYDVDDDGCVDDLDADGDGSPCADDCDDGDARAFPGASDACGDGVDANCDGLDEPCADDGAGEPSAVGPGDCGCQPASPAAGAPALLSLAALSALASRRRRVTTP